MGVYDVVKCLLGGKGNKTRNSFALNLAFADFNLDFAFCKINNSPLY